MDDSTTKCGRIPAWYVKLTRRARKLKRRIWALFLAWKDPVTPVYAKIVIAVTVAYALSPIDLIPDFIPILGVLDDLIILPLLIALAVRLIPPEVSARTRREAWRHFASGDRIKSHAGRMASIVFICIWIVLIAWLAKMIVEAVFSV